LTLTSDGQVHEPVKRERSSHKLQQKDGRAPAGHKEEERTDHRTAKGSEERLPEEVRQNHERPRTRL
jgi:hypothetical protein